MKYEHHIANREKQARFLAPATFIPTVSGRCKSEFINQSGKTKGPSDETCAVQRGIDSRPRIA